MNSRIISYPLVITTVFCFTLSDLPSLTKFVLFVALLFFIDYISDKVFNYLNEDNKSRT